MRKISTKLKSIFKYLFLNSEQKGFTIPELVVAIGIFIIMATIATLSVVNIKQKASLDTTANILLSDIKQQQLKAMVGDTEGRGILSDYGIHLSTDSYTLFHGENYVEGSPGNFTIQLGDNIQFVSGVDLVFSQISGEIGSDMEITLIENTTQEQKTIEINRFGVVTDVN